MAEGHQINQLLANFNIDITKKDPDYYSNAANMVRKYKDFALDVDID